MARYWKRNSIWITGLSALLLVIALAIALGWNPADAMLSSATVSAKNVDAIAQSNVDTRLHVATLRPVSEVLSQLELGANSGEVTSSAEDRLLEADVLRENGSPPEAIRAYILVLDKYPDTPQAMVADERFNCLLGGRTEAELDAIEAALPSPKELTDVDGITAIGQFYFKRALDAGEKNPEKAAPYLQAIYGIGLPVFKGNLDDGYKTTLLNGYLQVADALGKGKEAREALTKLAGDLPPCFTSWLISTEVLGVEPPFEFVRTEQGQAAVRKYYMDKAKESKDPAVSSTYYAKSRDVSWQLFELQKPDVPKLDDVLNYLQAASALGESEQSAAVSSVEKWLDSEPLSIKRWIARYELAMYTVGNTLSEEESREVFRSFETLVKEAESGIVETAVNNTSLDENLRGLLVCMWGHTYAGTNRIDDARYCYQWVLDHLANETHAGASAAYSIAIMDTREHYDDPALSIAALEFFVDGHPGNRYSAEALMQVADLRMQSKELALAKNALERLELECANTSLASSAALRIEAIMQEESRQTEPTQAEVQ